MTRSHRALRISILVFWMLLITVWSDQSSLPIDAPEVRLLFFNVQHRIAHLIAFGLLGLLGAWAFEGHSRAVRIAIAITAAFAATDEIHQSWVPGRHAGVDDWLFDILSAGLALYIWPRLHRARPSLRAVAPYVVAAIFAVGIILLTVPHLSRPPELTRASIRTISNELIGTARDAAQQLRALRSG